jgi:endo-1,4-beta-xylanase
MGEKKLIFAGPDGAPVKGAEVSVEQKKHGFLFGCAEFSSVPYANGEYRDDEKAESEERFEKFFEVFNYITLPFYWARVEPVRGEPKTGRLKKAAQWLASRGMRIKGHTLCWHTLTAPWLLDMSNAEILAAQLSRIRRDVGDFAGLIDMWDVINEVVIMPVFNRYDNGITRICKELGRIRTVREMFSAAKEANPDAMLLINDFETSEAYDILIEGLLEAGIPIDAVGIQSHMHQGYWGVEKTQEIVERFSRFRLPIYFTENTLVSGRLMPPEIVDLNDYQVDDWPSTPEGEERQAGEAALHYRTLFAHPAVESISWWDFKDGGWLKAPAGLIRRDGTAKPAYEELRRLIKDEWWTKPLHAATDGNGSISVSGFLGEYEVNCRGAKRRFIIYRNGGSEVITL